MSYAKDAKAVAVYGRRGAGKSTCVKRLIRDCRRLVVWDPMGEYGRERGIAATSSVAATLRQMQAGWARGFRVAYVPSGDFVASLHRLSVALWGAQAPYDAGRDPRKIMLVVEEMNLGFPHSLPAGKDGFLRLILQGRHRGIEIIGVTQRPALVSPNFRSNTAETYCFALADHVDLETLKKQVGKRALELQRLENHRYLHIAGGQVSEGKNRLR